MFIGFHIVLYGFLFNAFAANHYVDKNAGGSNDGTNWANAWESFSAINWSSVNPGDNIYISGGTDSTVYSETMTVNASGTPGHFITITKGTDAGHNGKVIFDGLGTIQYGIVLSKSAGLSYLRLADLYFRNYDEAVRIRSTANVIYLDSLNIRRLRSQGGIALNGWNSQGDVTLIDSVFIRYSDIRSDLQVDAQTDCIYVQYADNVFILNNVIYQLNETGDSHSDGIQCTDAIGRMVIANNYIYQKKYTSSHGMMLNYSRIDSSMYIYNNVVWQQGGVKGISVAYVQGDRVDAYLYNNTVVLDNPANVMYPVGFWPARVHSKNNILYSVTSGYDFATSTPTELNDINYNIYRNTSSGLVVAFNGTGYSWNNWKSMAGSPDSHSYHSTASNYPDFTDMTNGDFTIQPGSPAAGSGTNLQNEIQGWGIEGVEWKDINGVPRGSSPSIGAYEIQGGGGGGNNLPSQPVSPAPGDGALNQNTNTTLSWSCSDPDGDPLTYDVYFGTTSNPPLVGSNQSNTNYNPGQLDNNTTYYWKIVAKDNQGGVTEGSVWNFSTIVSGGGGGSNSASALIKVLLEGPYTNNEMSTDLSANSLIPTAQPYNTQPWNYSGTEVVGAIPENTVDWILIELRSGTGSSTAVARRAAFLRNDGMVVDLNGQPKISFEGVESGLYYIVIYHRNHLAIMSKDPISLSDSSTLYDFSLSENQAYGNQAMKALGSGKYGMFAADGNSNGNINSADYVGVWKRQNGTLGYQNGDFDLNGGVNIADKNSKWNPNKGQSSQVP